MNDDLSNDDEDDDDLGNDPSAAINVSPAGKPAYCFSSPAHPLVLLFPAVAHPGMSSNEAWKKGGACASSRESPGAWSGPSLETTTQSFLSAALRRAGANCSGGQN